MVNWIKCSDMMPRKGRVVLISTIYKSFVLACLSENYWYNWQSHYQILLEVVTHWAEIQLPEETE